MMVLVTGGASSGKSAYAEEVAQSLPGPHYYLAAMKPYGEEAARRIERHREMRRGKGFETIEVYDGLQAVVALADGAPGAWDARGNGDAQRALTPSGMGAVRASDALRDSSAADGPVLRGTALLECLGNVVANEMFDDDGSITAPDQVLANLAADIDMLADRFDNLVIVGNEVGSDGMRYDDVTRDYIRVIGATSCAIAQRCDVVVECIAGQPSFVKGSFGL